MNVRAATPADFPAILDLNAESVHFLSPLSPERLAALHAGSELHCAVEKSDSVIAFLLAFREDASYDSVNYQWFQQRYERFLYVDRVVVSSGHQGHGIGRLLYNMLFHHAAATGVPLVTCEYDIDPPNPASERFHVAFGFEEVGRQTVSAGKKSVSLQVSRLKA